MITRTNGSKWGIKDSKQDFTPEIHSIINKAKTFIVVCGYNFSPLTHKTSIIPLLIARKNAGVNVLFIAPPSMIHFGGTNHSNLIQYLINNDIGVILNSYNHSKWIISDNGYYYGSLNFTHSSMKDKIEVVSFCNSIGGSRSPIWMSETSNELLTFAIIQTRNTKAIMDTLHLGMININTLRILNLTLNRILRFNPSIEKILTTLDNYEEVRLDLSKIIDDIFPFTNFESLDKFWHELSKAVHSLDRLAVIGNNIFLKIETQKDKSLDFELNYYNKVHTVFRRQIINLKMLVEKDQIIDSKQEKTTTLITESERVLTKHMDEMDNS